MSAPAGFAESRDPVTLVFEAGKERLSLELGMIDEVRLTTADADGPQVLVQLSDKASGMLAQLTGRHMGERMDVYACRDKVLSVDVRERISSGQVVIAVKDVETGRKMMDLIWNGDGCDLYLER